MPVPSFGKNGARCTHLSELQGLLEGTHARSSPHLACSKCSVGVRISCSPALNRDFLESSHLTNDPNFPRPDPKHVPLVLKSISPVLGIQEQQDGLSVRAGSASLAVWSWTSHFTSLDSRCLFLLASGGTKTLVGPRNIPPAEPGNRKATPAAPRLLTWC